MAQGQDDKNCRRGGRDAALKSLNALAESNELTCLTCRPAVAAMHFVAAWIIDLKYVLGIPSTQ